MRNGREGPYFFTSRDEDSEDDEAEGTTTRPRNPWLAPISPLVERGLVWGGDINPSTRSKSQTKVTIEKIEREVNEFHCERMNTIVPPPSGAARPRLSQSGRRPKHPK